MKRILSAFLLTLSLATQAGLPPTSSKISGESVYSTTFKTDFGTFKGTRSGTTLTLNSIGAGVGDSLALGGTKAASAILDVQSTTQGVLPPRMTTAQMLAIATPATGLTIYNTDINSLASWNGTTWVYGFGSLNVATPRTVYTPTFTGFGTVSGVDCNYARDGEFLDLDCKFTSGSPAGVEARISLPSGLTSSSLGVLRKAGSWDSTDFAATFFYISPLIEPSVSYFTVGSQTSVTGALVKLNGNSITSSGKTHSFNVRIPIEGWSSNTSAWVQANSNPIATTTEFSALSSSAGVASNINISGWIGNAVVTSTSVYTFPITGFTTKPNCVGTANSSINAGVAVFYDQANSNSSSIVFITTNSSSGGYTAFPFSINCQRSGADYTAAHSPFIIGIQQSVNMYSATPTATTSGTSHDFLIPANVKRVNIMFNGVSTNGTSQKIIRIGDGAIVSSGYLSSAVDLVSTGTVVGSNATSCFLTDGGSGSGGASAAAIVSGSIQLSSIGSNTWVISGTTGYTNTAATAVLGGSKTLTGMLDRVRLTTVNGTDTFDAGNVNVSWEF